MKFSTASFFPIAVKLGDYLIETMNHVIALQTAGVPLSPDLVAAWLALKMQTWSPVINGRAVLDDDTRLAAARFLAGVGFNLAGKKGADHHAQ